MTNQPELYRVQTTAGGSVVVWINEYNGIIREVCGHAYRSWQLRGYPADREGIDLDLSTLTPLHLLSDAELQARDDALLKDAADECDSHAAWLRANRVGMPEYTETAAGCLETTGRNIRSMKGTKP